MDYNNNIRTDSIVPRHGPVNYFISASVSLGGIFLCFLILLFVAFLLISNFKTRNYQPVEVTFLHVGVSDFDDAEVSYSVNDVDYIAKLVVDGDYKVGDNATFYCDLSNPARIIEHQSSFNYVFPVFMMFLLIFIAFIISFKRKINNYLHFINPSRYKYDYTNDIREEKSLNYR